MEGQGYVRHRRGARYARPLLVDEGAARGRDVALGSLMWGMLMGLLAAVALGVV